MGCFPRGTCRPCSGSGRFAQREPEERLEGGGKSLQVKIVLSPASSSYPGLVTVNTCLLALLAIAPTRVTECCPQSHGNRGRGWGNLSWLVPGVRLRRSAGAGVGLGEHAAPPAQTAPSRGFMVGCARQSHRELHPNKELRVQPLSQGAGAVAERRDVPMQLVEAERRRIHTREVGSILLFFKETFSKPMEFNALTY